MARVEPELRERERRGGGAYVVGREQASGVWGDEAERDVLVDRLLRRLRLLGEAPSRSALKLEDPRLPMMMARPSVSEEASEAERPFVYLKPQPGTVLMWESWLRHEVPVNAARSDRISVSFNYA